MTTKISDTEMTSDQTRHTAAAVSGSRYGSWTVTWLLGLYLSYAQAITAMTIADVIGAHDVLGDPLHAGHRLWPHLDRWAAELGITGPHALAAVSMSPEDHADITAVITMVFDSEPGRRGYLLSTDPATGMARVRINGETVTMPAAHLQLVGEPAQAADASEGVRPAPADGRGNGLLDLTHPDRLELIGVMTDHERAWLLAFIAGYATEVFDHAVTARSESFADELFGRIEDRDEAEYRAEPDGYCTACGANASWFIGFEGPQHFRGPHKLTTGSERRELFTPDDGHAPLVAWRAAAALPQGQADDGSGCPSVGPQGTRCTGHDGSGMHRDGLGGRWDDPAHPLCAVCGQAAPDEDGLCELCAFTPAGEL